MAKRRKPTAYRNSGSKPTRSEYNVEEQFNDSEDDFYQGNDTVLLDDGPVAKRRRKIEQQESALQLSDEEVFAAHDQDDDESGRSQTASADSQDDVSQDDDDQEEQGEEDEEEAEGWGLTRADYYNADMIETEADALDEETEAGRLQQKQLKAITIADFGLDEPAWTRPEVESALSGPIVEKLPDLTIPATATTSEKASILRNRYPEFSLLAKDFVELQSVWVQLQEQTKSNGSATVQNLNARTKLNALSSYLGTIAMYFVLVSSKVDPDAEQSKITALSPNEIRQHLVIDKLVASKRLWDLAKGVREPKIDPEIPERPKLTTNGKSFQSTGIDTATTATLTGDNARRSSTDSDSLVEPDQVSQSPPSTRVPKKALNLKSLLAQSAVRQDEDENDFGDEEPLTEEQQAEKTRRKRSLRFYTSQIAQKVNRRGAASREAGGDDDVPFRERLRDKQERLLREAEQRGKQRANVEEELGGRSEDETQPLGDDDYYTSLVNASKQKKAKKQARAEAYTEAARQGGRVHEQEQIGPDGKRKITYAIEKNKGLAPKRNKDVRNPRVKKRKKYDEKVKKLGSVRQVYKGGEGRGGYGGELTGIKTNVVKSVKL